MQLDMPYKWEAGGLFLLVKWEFTQKAKTMEPQQKKRIEAIIKGMECEKDFICYKSNFKELCKCKNPGHGIPLNCLKDNYHGKTSCKFKKSFSVGYLCTCPLRIYIARNLEK